jgi:enamine deaminase RidA (YjgF/YER057c/UK114 family)
MTRRWSWTTDFETGAGGSLLSSGLDGIPSYEKRRQEVSRMMETIDPHGIAQPVGWYTHAIKVSPRQLVFVAGQVPIDQDGNVVGVDRNGKLKNHQTIDLAVQVRQTFLNVKAALEAAGASMKQIVRLDTYVVSSAMNEWRTVGRSVKQEMLEGAPPPGATVFVTGLMIPDALLEISAIAAIE